ncbi:hypothetical protein PCANC_27685 [Puccinia coronata f. sp. avenae]|uniref:Uncharacterized protein n=1 Tax=Puccinia coronata f. sp. avenae TaxID=200324 RepID=A0A2N5RVY4_9BASI|nr:hypothetical protein PCANC_27685 [Puccinia coronata f. sp. avenae]
MISQPLLRLFMGGTRVWFWKTTALGKLLNSGTKYSVMSSDATQRKPGLGDEFKRSTINPMMGEQGMTEGRQHLDPSPVSSSGADSSADRQIDHPSVSKKRTRDGQTKEVQLAESSQSTKDTQTAGIINIQDLLSAANDGNETSRSAFNLDTGDFTLVRLNENWHPLFDWAFARSGLTDESDTMKAFVMQFNIKEQAMSRQIDMQRRSGHAQKDSNDCPNHLFRVDRDSQGQLSIRLAHPKGDHQVEPYSKIAQPVKARICKVLEFLGIFHGLAVSHGVNKMLGTTANLQGLAPQRPQKKLKEDMGTSRKRYQN